MIGRWVMASYVEVVISAVEYAVQPEVAEEIERLNVELSHPKTAETSSPQQAMS